MEALLSAITGYLMGSVSPSAFIAGIKGIDIRKSGTKNLGATNTMINFGKCAGLFVMLFDIFKAFFAFRLAQILFPSFVLAGLTAGSAAVVGHIFPFYLGFRGGKGFASLGGLILAFDADVFLLLLGFGLALMIVTNLSLSLQFTAALLFPVWVWLRSASAAAVLISSIICALVLAKHRTNIAAAWHGEDVRVRDFVREHFGSRR